jgi:hypothetical protein
MTVVQTFNHSILIVGFRPFNTQSRCLFRTMRYLSLSPAYRSLYWFGSMIRSSLLSTPEAFL